MRLMRIEANLPLGRGHVWFRKPYYCIFARLMWAVPLASIGLLLLACPSLEAQPTNGRIADGIGVAAHRPKDIDLDRIRGLGVSIVRTDLNWEVTEKAPGQYNFNTYIQMAKAMRERGLRPMFILDYSNSLYMERVVTKRRGNPRMQAAAPATPRAVAAYAAWAAAAVSSLSAYDPIWEIWNEPDVAHFWPPAPDADAYRQLVSNACAAMRKVSPRVMLIGPAAANPPSVEIPYPKFLHRLMTTNALSCLDGISVHPYQNRGLPSIDLANWSRLREIITRYMPTLPPMINSEWGISSIQGVSEYDQALYLVRSLVLNLAAGVDVNIWYQWRDEGTDPNDDQQHFGLTWPDGIPKPAGLALRTFLSEVGEMRFFCMVSTGPEVVAAAFTSANNSSPIIIVWSLREKLDWTLPGGLTVDRMVTLTGENKTVQATMEINGSPLYLHLRPSRPLEETDASTKEICAANQSTTKHPAGKVRSN